MVEIINLRFVVFTYWLYAVTLFIAEVFISRGITFLHNAGCRVYVSTIYILYIILQMFGVKYTCVDVYYSIIAKNVYVLGQKIFIKMLMYYVQCTLCIVQCTLHFVHRIIYRKHIVQCRLCVLQWYNWLYKRWMFDIK